MDTYRCGGGDILVGRYLYIDLDTGKIDFQYATLEDPGLKHAPFGLSVKPHEAERVQILAQTHGRVIGSLKWRLQLKLLVDGKEVTRFIDNNGRDFVTVSTLLS
jgi:hypothetical protein